MPVCECCTETVQTIDEDGLCFNCRLVQHFAGIIEEQLNVDSATAVDVACNLVEYARNRILEVDIKDGGKGFFADVAVGMVRLSKDH
jgi:hypothetical protein